MRGGGCSGGGESVVKGKVFFSIVLQLFLLSFNASRPHYHGVWEIARVLDVRPPPQPLAVFFGTGCLNAARPDLAFTVLGTAAR